MEAEKKYEERHELMTIYNTLPLLLKKQLLTIARVIDGTREIVLNEGKHKRVKKDVEVE